MTFAATSTTLADALRDAEARLGAAGIDDARIEAALLLCHALGCSRAALYAALRDPLPTRSDFDALLRRRLAGEPAAYITGRREFYGLEIRCTPAALIPRPETELLVERALAWLPVHDPAATVVDVGTGSGAIAVAIATRAPAARVVAIDTSRDALDLTRRNAASHGAERIDCVQGSLLDSCPGPLDVIIANLPYIPSDVYATLPPEIRLHEPGQALLAGPAGTELIEALLAQAASRLRTPGLLLAEHAHDQGAKVASIAARTFPRARIETAPDLAGLDRALVLETT